MGKLETPRSSLQKQQCHCARWKCVVRNKLYLISQLMRSVCTLNIVGLQSPTTKHCTIGGYPQSVDTGTIYFHWTEHLVSDFLFTLQLLVCVPIWKIIKSYGQLRPVNIMMMVDFSFCSLHEKLRRLTVVVLVVASQLTQWSCSGPIKRDLLHHLCYCHDLHNKEQDRTCHTSQL